MKTCIMQTLAVVIYCLLIIGCASPGSPSVTFSKDVHVHIANGEMPADVSDITVNVDYHQQSETGIESAIEQQLQELLNPALDLDLGVMKHESIHDTAQSGAMHRSARVEITLPARMGGSARQQGYSPAELRHRLRLNPARDATLCARRFTDRESGHATRLALQGTQARSTLGGRRVLPRSQV